MSGITAVLLIGMGLVITLLVGILAQLRGSVVVEPVRRTAPPPPQSTISDEQEDLAALQQRIEESRTELVWLREQVMRERTRLEGMRRQAPQQPPATPPPAAPAPDSPWMVLGIKPGAGAEEARKRYRLLSRVWHPDRFIEGPPELRAEAELMMARLNRAYTALSSQETGTRR